MMYSEVLGHAVLLWDGVPRDKVIPGARGRHIFRSPSAWQVVPRSLGAKSTRPHGALASEVTISQGLLHTPKIRPE